MPPYRIPPPPPYAPQPKLSYLEWLAQNNAGNPYAPQPQQQPGFEYQDMVGDLAKNYALKEGGQALAGQAAGSGAATAAAGLPASEAASVAYNAAATEAGGGMAAGGGLGVGGIGGSLGTAGTAGLGAMGALYGAGLYNYGGRGVLKDGGDTADYVDLALQANPLTAWVNPVVDVFGGGSVGKSLGLGHKSTRERTAENTQRLREQNPEDAQYQNYVQGMRQQYEQAPLDPSKPFAGKYGSWGEYEKAGLEAGDLTGVLGNIDTFGKDWTSLGFDEQKAKTQQLIDAGQYYSKDGEVKIRDAEKARQIFNSGAAPQSPGRDNVFVSNRDGDTNAPIQIPRIGPEQPARSQTLSPGIGLDGKPTNYRRR